MDRNLLSSQELLIRVYSSIIDVALNSNHSDRMKLLDVAADIKELDNRNRENCINYHEIKDKYDIIIDGFNEADHYVSIGRIDMARCVLDALRKQYSK